MLEGSDTPQSPAVDQDLPTPPRGRRAASRPAGPPKPVAEVAADFESELQARMQAQLAPADADTAATESAAETAPVADDGDAAPAKPARKRATRKKAAAAEEEPAPRTRRTRKTAASDDDATTKPRRTRKKAAAAVETPAADEAEPSLADQVAERLAQTTELPAAESGAAPAADADDTVAEVGEEQPTEAPADEAAAQPDSAEADAAEQTDAAEEDESADSDESGETDDSETDDSAQSDEADDAEADDSAESDDAESSPRRRRRRRGGRRRRRSGSSDASDGDDSDDDDSDDSAESGDTDAEDDQNQTDGADSDGNGEGRRRRRRRRRRGEDTGGSDDPDTDVVVKVREPRRSKANDEVTGIEGSTRMEAKRQRRREGRAAGRRRTPILSEAEFLARRESVHRTMVIRQNEELAQLAVLEDNVLVEHYVDRASALSLIGNVYLGRVQNVLPSMEAAFVDIGRGRNAVLYAGEVDWDSFGAEGQQRKVEKVLKSGQTVLVQVTKDPVGAKGARLTNHISLPGRYIVYSPGGHLSGISRKLPDTERKRLKEILSDLVGEDASVIVRTAAEGASEDELVRDVNRLKAQWDVIEKKVKEGKAPQQLYAEPDPTVRIVRDLFTEDFGKLIIDGNDAQNDAYDTVTAYVGHVAPHLAERIERWDRSKGDVFTAHRIDEQIAKALERKVYLPSGGSLVIDRTEAMTVIDVNTGKFTGSGGNLEATVTSNNLEAAEEVVRQLRLRDIGGIIVIDFIDMVLPSNRELLLRRLVECLGRDRTRHQVAEVTSLGLVQMTRKRIGTGLAEAFTETCEQCSGRGYLIHELPVDSQAQADGGERRRGRGGRGNRGGDNSRDHDRHDKDKGDKDKADKGDKDKGDKDKGRGEQRRGDGNENGRGRRRRGERAEPAPEVTPDEPDRSDVIDQVAPGDDVAPEIAVESVEAESVAVDTVAVDSAEAPSEVPPVDESADVPAEVADVPGEAPEIAQDDADTDTDADDTANGDDPQEA